MLTTIKALMLAARLYALPATGSDPLATEKICQEYYPGRGLEDDMVLECGCALSSWQCEAQGRCDREETAPYQASGLGLPDPYRIPLGCR